MIGKHKQAVILGFYGQEIKIWLYISNKGQKGQRAFYVTFLEKLKQLS